MHGKDLSIGVFGAQGAPLLYLLFPMDLMMEGFDLRWFCLWCPSPFSVAGDQTANLSPSSSDQSLARNQFDPSVFVELLSTSSTDYLQQIKHRLESVIQLQALGFRQCTQL